MSRSSVTSACLALAFLGGYQSAQAAAPRFPYAIELAIDPPARSLTTDLALASILAAGGPDLEVDPRLLASWDRSGGAQQSSPQPQEPKRWSDFLPLMKEEALSRGYQLPLPFGAGVTATILTGRD